MNTSAGTRVDSPIRMDIRQLLLPTWVRKGDRVELLDRDSWMLEVAYTEANVDGRFDVHLLRLDKEVP